MTSIFIMGPSLIEETRRVRQYAERPEHWYRPEIHPPPGNNPAYILVAGTVRAVFSWTRVPGRLLRHMTVSTQRRYPQPVIVWTLAYHFGFTGVVPDKNDLVWTPGLDWGFETDPAEGCVIVQQSVQDSPELEAELEPANVVLEAKPVVKIWLNIMSVADHLDAAQLAKLAQTAPSVTVVSTRLQREIGHTLRYEFRDPDLWAECEIAEDPSAERASSAIATVKGEPVLLGVLLTTLPRGLLRSVGMGLSFSDAIKLEFAGGRKGQA